MDEDYRAQLLVVEAELAKNPENEELKSLRSELLELLEIQDELEDSEEVSQPKSDLSSARSRADERLSDDNNLVSQHSGKAPHSGLSGQGRGKSSGLGSGDDEEKPASSGGQTTAGGAKRVLSEAELLAKKREKNRKKKAKLREKHKEQLDTAESVKQSWQSFASKKGLKGITKKSIFASPYSLTGKVGIGTNGIADKGVDPSLVGGASSSRMKQQRSDKE